MTDEASAPAPDVVEVVYAKRDEQRIVRLPLEPGLTAAQAVQRSGLTEEYPEIATHPLRLGIFGTAVSPDRPLVAGDRVEICRPLSQDPRELRRSAVAAGGVVGRRGGGRDTGKEPAQ